MRAAILDFEVQAGEACSTFRVCWSYNPFTLCGRAPISIKDLKILLIDGERHSQCQGNNPPVPYKVPWNWQHWLLFPLLPFWWQTSSVYSHRSFRPKQLHDQLSRSYPTGHSPPRGCTLRFSPWKPQRLSDKPPRGVQHLLWAGFWQAVWTCLYFTHSAFQSSKEPRKEIAEYDQWSRLQFALN